MCILHAFYFYLVKRMFEVKIPREVIQRARRVAEQIHKNRSGNKDKFLQGDEARNENIVKLEVVK